MENSGDGLCASEENSGDGLGVRVWKIVGMGLVCEYGKQWGWAWCASVENSGDGLGVRV